MTRLAFTVPGEARGKGRPRFARRGKYVKTYTDEKTVSFENLVAFTAQQAMRESDRVALIDGPVRVRMDIYVGIPRSWSKRKQAAAECGHELPTSKPDIDNVVKACMDALNGIVWRDDSQVCTVTVAKRYSSVPRTVIVIEEQDRGQ